MIFTAQFDTLEQLWLHAKPHIERFSSETMLISPDDMYRDISTGDKQLWMTEAEGIVNAVVITQIYPTQKGSICCVWAACGNSGIESLVKVLGEIEKWARSIDCVALEIRGRKGWSRVLPQFKQTGVLLEKDLRQVH
jgi:hypothetical protein